jgi:ABC-type multidrug transport system fused ATPase/permease subunit
MTSVQKLRFLLSAPQKKQLLVLAGLLIIGMIFEMAGLGILIPAFGVLLKPNIAQEYPSLAPILNTLGNPTQVQLVLGGMIMLIIIYSIKSIFLVFLSWKQSKFTAGLWADLSRTLFFGYLKLPYSFHLQKNSAELLRNIQTEVGQFTIVCLAAITLTLELSALVGVAFMLIIIEPVGALVVTAFLALSAIGFHRLTKNKLLFWGQMRQYHASLTNQHLLQGLAGVKDVKLTGREEQFLEEFTKHNNAYAKIRVKVDTLGLIPRFYLELLAVVGLAGLIILMTLQHKPMDLLLPTLGVFVAAAFRMIPSVNRIMSSVQQIRHAQPVINVLYEEIKMMREDQAVKPKSIPLDFKESIVIDNVRFSYPAVSSPALDGVYVHIKKGESVGFIGPSGSGKSTLVDVLLGLLEPSDGQIKIDGKDIRDGMRNWHNQVGYVPQSIYLTDDTLRRNVAFGIPSNQINDEAVRHAINAAQLDEFVESLPEGLETFVGERGVRLSGGQRQRIGIARALYNDPPVLVLDEATSALDSATESYVMEAVNALHGNKTLLIVAHRLTTLRDCDKIYKLDHGMIISSGVPDDMFKAEKNYHA